MCGIYNSKMTVSGPCSVWWKAFFIHGFPLVVITLFLLQWFWFNYFLLFNIFLHFGLHHVWLQPIHIRWSNRLQKEFLCSLFQASVTQFFASTMKWFCVHEFWCYLVILEGTFSDDMMTTGISLREEDSCQAHINFIYGRL